MNSRIQTCFITAPTGGNLEVLIDALHQHGIQVVAPKNIEAGREQFSEITDLLSRVDLVIGVITRERRSEWALFELGIAWGLGKRILLFAPPSSSHFRSTLRHFFTVRANISNREAVQFALDQVLAAPETSQRLAIPREQTRPLGASADAYLQDSIHLGQTLRGAEMEHLVARALAEAGVEVVATAPNKLRGADLAIWSDAFQTTVGNPLLVEIKAQLSARGEASEAVQRLARYVVDAGGRWGLLLYSSGPDRIKSLPQNILALRIDALFERLKNQSFDEVVHDLLNRRVHGSDLN